MDLRIAGLILTVPHREFYVYTVMLCNYICIDTGDAESHCVVSQNM